MEMERNEVRSLKHETRAGEVAKVLATFQRTVFLQYARKVLITEPCKLPIPCATFIAGNTGPDETRLSWLVGCHKTVGERTEMKTHGGSRVSEMTKGSLDL
jgi:hypothetical protein